MRCFLCALVLLLAGCTQAQTVADPHWYILLPVDQLPSKHLTDLKNPKVDGISTRVRWSTLNPKPGVYNFALVDRVASEARKAGKPWTLRIMGGDGPGFVPNQGGYPIPWDAKTKSAFGEMIAAAGKRYAADPWLKMVHVPGFGDSAEMHVPKGVSWPTNSMVDAWDFRIDATAAAFGSQLICLNHSPEAFSPAVRQWHMRLGKSRAVFQMNALKASTNTSWEGYDVLKRLHADGWAIGFQHACPSTNRSRFGGTFAQATTKGKAAGARWYEYYQPDTKLLP